MTHEERFVIEKYLCSIDRYGYTNDSLDAYPEWIKQVRTATNEELIALYKEFKKKQTQ